MKNRIFLLILLPVLFSCGTNTKIVHSWRDPDVIINTHSSGRFIIAALLKNESIRRRVEDLMTINNPQKAMPSYKEWGSGILQEEISRYNEDLRKRGFDAVVILRLVQVDKMHPYQHGIYPAYYNTWKEYYNFAWESYYHPSNYVIKKTYYVEVNVYYLLQNKLVWSGITSTLNPSGSDELFDDVISTVKEKMKKEGFLQ